MLRRHGFIRADGEGPDLNDPSERERLKRLFPDLAPFLPQPGSMDGEKKPLPSASPNVQDQNKNDDDDDDNDDLDGSEVWSQMSGSIAERCQMSAQRRWELGLAAGPDENWDDDDEVVNLPAVGDVVATSSSKTDGWISKHFVEDREKGIWQMKPRRVGVVEKEEKASTRDGDDDDDDDEEENVRIMREIFADIWKGQNVEFKNVSFNVDKQMVAEYKRKQRQRVEEAEAKRRAEAEKAYEKNEFCVIPMPDRPMMKIPWAKIRKEWLNDQETKENEAKMAQPSSHAAAELPTSEASTVENDRPHQSFLSAFELQGPSMKIPWKKIMEEEDVEGDASARPSTARPASSPRSEEDVFQFRPASRALLPLPKPHMQPRVSPKCHTVSNESHIMAGKSCARPSYGPNKDRQPSFAPGNGNGAWRDNQTKPMRCNAPSNVNTSEVHRGKEPPHRAYDSNSPYASKLQFFGFQPPDTDVGFSRARPPPSKSPSDKVGCSASGVNLRRKDVSFSSLPQNERRESAYAGSRQPNGKQLISLCLQELREVKEDLNKLLLEGAGRELEREGLFAHD